MSGADSAVELAVQPQSVTQPEVAGATEASIKVPPSPSTPPLSTTPEAAYAAEKISQTSDPVLP